MCASPCAYCKRQLPLNKSHVLPQWIIKRSLATSATGRMRDGESVNKPVQDGEKLPLLCDACEQKFGKLESAQAKRYDSHKIRPGAEYDRRFSQFVVSVLWRVAVSRSDELLTAFPKFETKLASAIQTWRKYLECDCMSLGDHPASFLFLDHDTARKVFAYKDADCQGPSPVLHSYLHNSISTELVVYDQDDYVLSWAMGNSWLMAGVIAVPPSESAHSAIDICPTGGMFPMNDYEVPPIVLATLCSQSRRYLRNRQQISSNQLKKIQQLATRNTRQLNNRSQQLARDADIKMFGTAAIDAYRS